MPLLLYRVYCYTVGTATVFCMTKIAGWRRSVLTIGQTLPCLKRCQRHQVLVY
jgi:hypothetical protein